MDLVGIKWSQLEEWAFKTILLRKQIPKSHNKSCKNFFHLESSHIKQLLRCIMFPKHGWLSTSTSSAENNEYTRSTIWRISLVGNFIFYLRLNQLFSEFSALVLYRGGDIQIIDVLTCLPVKIEGDWGQHWFDRTWWFGRTTLVPNPSAIFCRVQCLPGVQRLNNFQSICMSEAGISPQHLFETWTLLNENKNKLDMHWG